ncbi:MAG TPA: MMPL family transporter [Actinotalea sp.]|nr:MMPL family transporter [Actinotalea sp.]
MTLGFTGRIAQACAARPWLTIGVWVLLLAAAVAMSTRLGGALSQEEHFLTTVESDVAADLDTAARGDGAPDQETVVVTSTTLTFDDPEFQAAVARAAETLRNLDGVAQVSAPTAGLPQPVSASGHAALVTATLVADPPDGLGAAVNDAVAGLSSDEIGVYPYGEASAGAAYETLADEGLLRGELIGIGAAVVILVLVFGALAASLVPLVVGGVAIAMAVGATALLGQWVDLSFFIVNMITMMGLALGIDYSLVVVQRYREELAHGRSVRDAVAVAGDTASRAVFFSALTVLISLLGMLVVPFSIMVSLSAGAMLVAAAAMVAALTLLPALLRLLGHRVNAGRLPWAHPGAEPRRWQARARAVMRRPWLGVAVGFAVLVTLAAPVLSMRMAFPSTESLPDVPFKRAVQTLAAEFGYGDATTTVVVTDAAGARAEVAALAAAIDADPGYAETSTEWVGSTAFVDARDAFDPASTDGEEALHRIRDELVPGHLAGTGATAHVGGWVAGNVDFNRVMADSAPWVALIVLGSSLVLLLVSFRSLVVAVMAVLLNVLSAAAAYGVLVAAYQWGWLAGPLGLPATEGVTRWLPVFLFAVLFGLSMDYHVFLLSRIKERHSAGDGVRAAVEHGLGRTGALITGAALIMVAVFSGFAMSDLAAMSQMGFGLAVAVILDATVIRTVLVPAMMALLGERNWYLPPWLRWLPHVHVETAAHAQVQTARTPVPVG